MDVLEEGMIRTTVNFTKVLRKQNWENTKIQILSQDMVRRLMNTKEELGATNRGAVVDMYAKKLLQSGYSREQTRKIITNGIKGFKSKRRSRIANNEPVRRTARRSMKSRHVRY